MTARRKLSCLDGRSDDYLGNIGLCLSPRTLFLPHDRIAQKPGSYNYAQPGVSIAAGNAHQGYRSLRHALRLTQEKADAANDSAGH